MEYKKKNSFNSVIVTYLFYNSFANEYLYREIEEIEKYEEKLEKTFSLATEGASNGEK